MAKQTKLTVERRMGVGRPVNRKLRQRDMVPAVIYGAHHAPENLQLGRKQLDGVLAHTANEHMLVELEITGEGQKEVRPALIQAVQHDPITTEVLHVDFLAVSMTETIVSEVPLEPTGESVGVKTHGGLLELLSRTLEVECLPGDLPEVIHFDVSHLAVGDSLHVRDLQLPTGVRAVSDGDLTVAMVSEPTVPVASVEAPATEPVALKEKKEQA